MPGKETDRAQGAGPLTAHIPVGRTPTKDKAPAGSRRSHQTLIPQAQNNPFCAALNAPVQVEADAQSGGYLESSLSTPSLTRTSAAWTCSRTVFT
jgi:hypothetical protein